MLRSIGLMAGLAFLLVACGGGGDSDPPTYTVGGTVTGLAGFVVVLKNEGGDDLPISASGSFTFATPMLSGASYSVTATTREKFGLCGVANGVGTIVATDVTNVAVTCVGPPKGGYAVPGLMGSGLALQHFTDTPDGAKGMVAASDPLQINSIGPFPSDHVFPGSLPFGTTRITQPPASPSPICSIHGATSIPYANPESALWLKDINIEAANVTDVEVGCSQRAYSLLLSNSLVGAQARRDVVSPNALRGPAHAIPAAGPRPLAAPLASAAARPALGANVIPATCPESNSVCGYVQVPLDRKHPRGTKIGIYFEQYFHTNSGPAVSAIMVNLGGPGLSTTDSRDYFQFGLFAANMDAHDLLLVDDRGRGQSGAIDCPELQHGTADFATAEHDCAVQLGAAASRYGSGDVALDMNDVREALGYDLIDYLGASWGGADAIAFATRFPEHTRSLVLDAPIGPSNVIPYVRLQSFRAHAAAPVMGALCSRSLLCAPDHPNPTEELSKLIQTIRAHAVEGDSYDASGNPVHVRIDEPALLDFVVRGHLTTINETLAASASLEIGDAAPLLRLAAEGFYTVNPQDSGDPTGYSMGAQFATACSDVGEPWEWSDAVAERLEEDNDFLRNLSPNYFAPFSHSIGKDILFSARGKQCLWWEKPTPSAPIAPRNAVYPSVPTLVLVGDLDNLVPTAASKTVAGLFPGSTFVTVANSRHETTGWTQCGRNLANQLIETLSPGDTSCAQTPEYIWPAVGRFPVVARYARPAAADSSGTNRIGKMERKVVSVAVAAATDALQRFKIGSGSGVGLRGGTFVSSGSFPLFSLTLTNCAFSEDVIANGTITWNALDGATTATLSVNGSGTAGGTLQVTGFWEGVGPLGYFQVTGTLGRKNVAVLVPEG